MANIRGSAFMVLSMLFFAIEDAFIKSIAKTIPLGEIMMIEGVLGAFIFSAMSMFAGQSPLQGKIFSRAIAVRSGFEIMGRLFYALAIVFNPISVASAILQASPLVVVALASILLKEPIDLRRWLSILIGFFGVILIVRPGLEGFSAYSIFALIGMLGFSCRDLATRMSPPSLTSYQLGVTGFIMLVISGLMILLFSGNIIWPDSTLIWPILCLPVFGVLAYQCLTKAMRTGDVSAVAPFRYSRLPFGILVGVLVFSESLDGFTIFGSLIIVCAGIYMMSIIQKPRLAASTS